MNRVITGIDYPLLFLYLLIASFGAANIFSVNPDNGIKQFSWLGISIIVGLCTFLVRPKFFENFAGLFYLLGLILLAGVLFIGKEINGAKAWYVFGPVSLQPVEFVKIFISLLLANFINSPNFNMKNTSAIVAILGIICTPIILILLQPDVGSIFVFTAFFIAAYREGFSGWLFVLGGYLATIFLSSLALEPLFVVLGLIILSLLATIFYLLNKGKFRSIKTLPFIISTLAILIISSAICFSAPFIRDHLPKHQRERIMVLFEGERKYRDTSGYNLLYSKTAIGSGGLTGKGYRQGSVTAGGFVPEQRTDYIFCTVGEEWGFIGSTILIIAYACLIGRIYYLAETQKTTFSRVFGYCLASVLFMHFTMNIAMVMGLFPTVGIPLPFFSYGGSSLLGFSLFTFIFLRLNYADKNSLI